MAAARIEHPYGGRPYCAPVSHAHISGADMIYGGRAYPTLIFFGSPGVKCRMPIATLTSLHPDLISRRSSVSSNSDLDFDSIAVDSNIGSILTFAIESGIDWSTDSGIDSRGVDSRIGSI